MPETQKRREQNERARAEGTPGVAAKGVLRGGADSPTPAQGRPHTRAEGQHGGAAARDGLCQSTFSRRTAACGKPTLK